MADKNEKGYWFSLENGTHIHVGEGETPKQATERVIGKGGIRKTAKEWNKQTEDDTDEILGGKKQEHLNFPSHKPTKEELDKEVKKMFSTKQEALDYVNKEMGGDKNALARVESAFGSDEDLTEDDLWDKYEAGEITAEEREKLNAERQKALFDNDFEIEEEPYNYNKLQEKKEIDKQNLIEDLKNGKISAKEFGNKLDELQNNFKSNIEKEENKIQQALQEAHPKNDNYDAFYFPRPADEELSNIASGTYGVQDKKSKYMRKFGDLDSLNKYVEQTYKNQPQANKPKLLSNEWLDQFYKQAGGDEDKMTNLIRADKEYQNADFGEDDEFSMGDLDGIIDVYLTKKTGKNMVERYKDKMKKLGY